MEIIPIIATILFAVIIFSGVWIVVLRKIGGSLLLATGFPPRLG
jgi:hypothetical protein